MATKKKDTAPVSVLRADQLQTKPKKTEKNTAPVSVLRAEQLLPAPKTEASAQRAQEALGIPYSAQRAAGYTAPAKSNIFSDTQRELFENATAFQKSFGTLDNFLQNKRTTKRGFFSRPEPTLGQSTAYHNAVLWDGAMQYQQKRVQDLAAQVSVLATGGPNVDRTGIYRDYVQAVNNYRSMIPQYNRAIDTYNGMAQAAKKLNEDWRKSIRSTDEIDKDVAALRQEIAAKWNERSTHAAQLMSNPDRLLPSALETRRKNEQAMVDRYDREIANLRKDEELLQEERFWSVFYKYEDLRNNSDFAELSKVTDRYMGGTFGQEYIRSQINRDPDEIGRDDLMLQTTDETAQARKMTDREREIYNYLYNTQGVQVATDYFKELTGDHLNRQLREDMEKYTREATKRAPLLMSTLSVVYGPAKSLGFLAQGIDYALDGTIDENAPYNKVTHMQRAIRDERADFYAKLAETKLGEGWGKLGSFGYQTAMSMADFIFTAAITGNFSVAPGTQAAKAAERLSLGIMSTGAAADATVEAKERGLSDGQAIVLGTVAGFAEYITEKVSLETLLNRIGVESGWWYLTKNVLAEGSEEVASDLINLGADIWISRDKAEWQRAIRAYENQGLDKRAAFQKAWNDQARGMLLSFAGGAISGGVMAGGSLVQNRIAYDQTLRNTGAADERVRQLVEAGKAQPEDSKAFRAAQALEERISRGEKINLKDAMDAARTVNRAIDRDLRSGLAENIGRNLLSEQMRSVIEESVDYLLSTKRSSQTYKLGQQLLNKLTNGENITAQEAGEAFLQAEKVASGEIGIRMERDLKPREVTAEMDELERSAAVIGVPEREVQNIKRIANKLGRRVLYESVAPENGKVQNGRLLTDGTIMINALGVDPYIQVFSHELTHDLEGTDAYEALSKLILSRIENIDAERERLGKLYKDGTDIDRELVAFYVQENLLQNEKAINEVVSRDRNFGRWMLDKLDDLLAKLGNENAKERAFLRKARRLYVKALRENGAQRDGEAASYTEYDNYSEDELRNLFDSTTDERLNASRAVGEFEDSEEYKRFFESVLGQKDGAVDEFNRWADESGYAKAYDTLREAERRLPEIRRKLDERIDQRLAQEEMDKVKASGKTEAEYFRQAAVREFGYTPFFYDAGYILPNGKMLNFSGEKGKHYGVRGEDHRGIGRIYESTQGSAAMNRFMKDGNIRIMAESPGLDICDTVEPTKEQYATIRRFVNENRGEEYFSIDFSDERGNNIGSIEYEGRIYTDRVVNDIKHFFATGEVREQSTLDRFRYSYSEDANADEADKAYLAALNDGDERKVSRIIQDAAIRWGAAKDPRYKTGKVPLHLYHGTPRFGFTEFRDANHKVPFIYTSTKREVSAHYAGDQNYAGVRTIGTKYKTGNNINDIIENAKWVLGSEYHVMSNEEKESRYSETIEIARKVSNKVAELYDANDMDFPQEIANAISMITAAPDFAADSDVEWDIEHYGAKLFDVDSEQRTRIAEDIDSYYERVDDLRREIERYKAENWKTLTPAAKQYLSYVTGYELGDALIDIHYTLVPAMTDGTYLVNEAGNINSPEALKNAMDATHSIGSYDLYGNLGSNPFEFDANGAQFWALKVPQIGDDYYSTDTVSKWALEHGYTSVIMHNIYDYGDKADNYVFFDSSQLKSADNVTYDDNDNVIPPSERFSESKDIRYSYAEEEDSQGRKLSENQAKFFENSKARDEQGRLLTLYHQTENDFTVFDPRHEGAGTRDNQTPYGIFLKSNTRDIGVRGKKQMALYANITNPLVVENRTALEGRLRKMSPEYADLSDQHRRLDSEYQKRFDEAQKKFRDFLTAWRAEHPNAGRTDVYEAEGFESAFGAADEVLKEWEAAARELETKTKNVITQVLEDQGYDGLFLQKDQGAWGRSTDAVVALRPEQVKNIDNQNPTQNPDIRYSLTEEPKGLELPSVDDAEINTAGAQETDGRLSLPMVEDGRQQRKMDTVRRAVELAVDMTQEDRDSYDNIFNRDGETGTEALKESTRPTRAKKWLNKTLQETFHAPDGMKNTYAEIIDEYTERAIRNKKLSEEDVQDLAARLYGLGKVSVRADEYNANMSKWIRNHRVYVNDEIRAEFGDDWDGFRKRAFAASVYLVTKDANAITPDAWNVELSEMFPSQFQADQHDQRTILEQIVDAAESGKTREMSLPEYLYHQEQMEGAAAADAMYYELLEKTDRAMESFAEMAGLEKDLKEQRFISDLQQRTLKQLQWARRNADQGPAVLKAAAEKLVGDFDILAAHAAKETRYSKKYNATYRDLGEMLKEAVGPDPGRPRFFPSEDLQNYVARVDGEHIDELDIDDLYDLWRALVAFRTEFENRKSALMGADKVLFEDIYYDAARDIRRAKGSYSSSGLAKSLNNEMLSPINVFERMGGWNRNGMWFQMAQQLEQGEMRKRAHIERARQELDRFIKKNRKWYDTADGQGRNGQWIKVEFAEMIRRGDDFKPEFGDTVTVWMTPLQRVHMYLESLNRQNLLHMEGGRTFVKKDLYQKGDIKEAFAQAAKDTPRGADYGTFKLAPETVYALTADMSTEERELADILHRYYNAKWVQDEINQTSNYLSGINKAMGGNKYAPIYTNQNYVTKEIGMFDTTSAGQGNMKTRVWSRTPSYNISAIEAFERSVEQTGQYVGLAIAERNWNMLLNMAVAEERESMKGLISGKWGDEGLKYVTETIKRLQGNKLAPERTRAEMFFDRLLTNYVGATFGFNFGVMTKQSASRPMAAAVLGWDTWARPDRAVKVDMSLVNTYTKELAYRARGFATPDTAELAKNPGAIQKNPALRFLLGGGTVIAMDYATIRSLWPWAENHVAKYYPDLEKGTDEQIKAGESPFYQKVAEVFNETIANTQPMYDEMHRANIMKNSKGLQRYFTMFKTVPLQMYNMNRQAWGEWSYAKQAYEDNATEETKAERNRAAAKVARTTVATVVSNLMLEAISFLAAYWTNRGKRYRDEDDELTAESFLKRYGMNVAEDTAGMVIYGKESMQALVAMADSIKAILTGEKNKIRMEEIQTPGEEQVNDLNASMKGATETIFEFVAGWADVAHEGEDVGAYLKRHAREYAGAAKDLIWKLSKYFGAVPMENLEKYIMGAVQFSPELTAAVEDVFKNPGKSDLNGLRGHMLRRKIEDVMTIRGVELSKMASDYLSTKYQNGVNVIPTDTPKEITVDGEPVKLTESQKLKYERAWAEAGQDINTLVASRDFQQADEATQQRMIGRLYAYATEEAKKAALGSYEQDAVAARAQAVVRAGGTAAQWAMLDATTKFKGANDVDAYDAIARSSAPESVKRAMFGAIKGTALTTESGEPTAYAKMQTVTAAGMTVSAYARWLAESGDKKTAEKIDLLKQFGYSDQIKRAIIETMSTDKQQEKMQQIVGSGVSVDGYLDIRANGAEDEYIKLLRNGIKGEKAAQAAILAQQVKDEAGPGATTLEMLRVAIDRSRSTKEQMDALTAILTTDQCRPYVVGNKMGVTPDIMVTAKEKMRDYDADQNGSYKNDEVTAMIEGVYGSGGKLKLPGSGALSNDQKAVLWQLLTGSTSAKNNPYSVEIGNQVLAAKAAQKETDGKLKLPG